MFTKTMKFDDLEGNEVEQKFYFNFSKKELAELIEFGMILRFAQPGETRDPLEKQLEKLNTPIKESGLSDAENTKMAYTTFEGLLLDAYGVKSEDNMSFNKSPELRHYWSTHVAFPELIFEFIENPSLAATFVEQCLPPRLVNEVKADMEKESKLGRGASLADLVEEAQKRQEDPATRIEPGLEAAKEALNPSPEVVKLAEQTASEKKKPADMTPADVELLSDEDFEKLDPRGLSQEAMLAAFQRKTRV